MDKKYSLAACIAAVIAAPAAYAQSSSSTANLLEEVVVTAQKRTEDLQDVPVAVSAYTSKARDLIGLSTIQDLTNFTPGLSYSTSLDRSSLRGIGRQTNNLASDPGVATYNDGFYNVSTRAASRSPLLVERIEVLRGPQGTLYGRNSIGGTINVVSRQPTTEWYSEVRASYDNWQRRVTEGAISGPITDWLQFRVAANDTKQDKGWYENISGGPDEGGIENDHYYEAQIAAQFGDTVDLWLKGSLSGYDNRRRTSANRGSYDYGRVPSGTLQPSGAYGLVLPGSNFTQDGQQTVVNPAQADQYKFSTDTPTRNQQDDSPTFIGHLTFDLGPVDLKYIGGYSSYNYLLRTDFDNTAVDSYTVPLTATSPCNTNPNCSPVRFRPNSVSNYIERKRYWSHELNLSSNGDGALQWIAGLYYYDEQYRQPVYFPTEIPQMYTPQFTSHASGPVTAGAAPNPQGGIYYIDTHLHSTSQAAFGQIDWAFADAWKATVGLRYTKDKKDGREFTRQLCYSLSAALGCPDIATNGTLTPASDITDSLTSHVAARGTTGLATVDPATGIWSRGLSYDWNATTGTAGVQWTPNTDTMAYVNYSRGYKAGGFNSGVITLAPLTEPEEVNAYEIGLKQQIGGSLQVNASLFFYDYSGMQIPLSVIPTAGPPQTQFFNLKKVESKGVEVETIWQPIEHLQVLFNYSYLDAKIKDGCCFVDGVDPQARQPDADPSGPLTGTSQGQSLVGATVPQSPKNKASLNVNYTFALTPGNLTFSVSDIWKDKTYFSVFNRFYSLAPSYNQVDARISFTTQSDHLTAILFGRNVLNDDGFDGRSGLLQTQLPLGGAGAPIIPQQIAVTDSYTPPRTYGLELQYRF